MLLNSFSYSICAKVLKGAELTFIIKAMGLKTREWVIIEPCDPCVLNGKIQIMDDIFVNQYLREGQQDKVVHQTRSVSVSRILRLTYAAFKFPQCSTMTAAFVRKQWCRVI